MLGDPGFMTTVKIKKYGCTKCGQVIEVHPPDDLHTRASRYEKECELRGSVKMEYKCNNCGELNTIYWCRRRKHPDWYA